MFFNISQLLLGVKYTIIVFVYTIISTTSVIVNISVIFGRYHWDAPVSLDNGTYL